jgi:hypothetical protein
LALNILARNAGKIMRKLIIVFGTWGLVWWLTGNVIYGIASMFFLPYILVKFFGFKYATNNYAVDTDDDNYTNHDSQQTLNNPSTGLPMCGNCAGGVDVSGKLWCE